MRTTSTPSLPSLAVHTARAALVAVAALAAAACVPPPAAGTPAYGSPAPGAAATTSAGAAAPASDGSGPPAVRRVVPVEDSATAGPYDRGDYLVFLDFRADGHGTYGLLHDGRGLWWVVENDEVVGGPHPDGAPGMQRATEAWMEAERHRHRIVMQGVAAMPHGCLDGCAFDVYRDGRYAGTRIQF